MEKTAGDPIDCGNFTELISGDISEIPAHIEGFGIALLVLGVCMLAANFWRNTDKIENIPGAVVLIAGIVLSTFPYSQKIGAEVAQQKFNLERTEGVGLNDQRFLDMIAHLCDRSGHQEKQVVDLVREVAALKDGGGLIEMVSVPPGSFDQLEGQSMSTDPLPPYATPPAGSVLATVPQTGRITIAQPRTVKPLTGVELHVFFKSARAEISKSIQTALLEAGATIETFQSDDFSQVKNQQGPKTIRILYQSAFGDDVEKITMLLKEEAALSGFSKEVVPASFLSFGPIQIQVY